MEKMTKQFFKEVNNFFENPNKIRSIGLSQKYSDCQNSAFPGKRSQRIPENNLIYEKIISVLVPELISNNIFNFTLNSFFQYTNKDTPCIEHIDMLNKENKRNIISGVIYLNPELPNGNYGTTIGDKKVSNEYNKLVYYSSDILHRPTGTFGNNLEDSRLIISFVLSER